MSMSIGDSSLYTDLLADTTNSSASRLEGKLNSDYTSSTEDELMEVCKEFEAYFTEQVFKALQKMVPESEGSSSSATQLMSYAKERLTQEYANNSSENGSGLGLAQMLYEQMKRNYNID